MKLVVRLLAVFAAIGVGLEALGLLAGEEHHGGFWNSVPLWDLGSGFVGAALLALVAKGSLKPRLARGEDYYGAEGDR